MTGNNQDGGLDCIKACEIIIKIIWCMNKENKYKLLETKEKEIQLKFPGN